MLRGISPKCVNEDVDVEKLRQFSIISSRAAELSTSTPGSRPPSPDVVKRGPFPPTVGRLIGDAASGFERGRL